MLAEQNRFGLGGIHHHADHHRTGRCDFGGVGTGNAAFSGKLGGGTRAGIAHMYRVTGAAQAARHAAPHGA